MGNTAGEREKYYLGRREHSSHFTMGVGSMRPALQKLTGKKQLFTKPSRKLLGVVKRKMQFCWKIFQSGAHNLV